MSLSCRFHAKGLAGLWFPNAPQSFLTENLSKHPESFGCYWKDWESIIIFRTFTFCIILPQWTRISHSIPWGPPVGESGSPASLGPMRPGSHVQLGTLGWAPGRLIINPIYIYIIYTLYLSAFIGYIPGISQLGLTCCWKKKALHLYPKKPSDSMYSNCTWHTAE